MIAPLWFNVSQISSSSQFVHCNRKHSTRVNTINYNHPSRIIARTLYPDVNRMQHAR